MRTRLHARLALLLLSALIGALPLLAVAQGSYPLRPVRAVLPYAPGTTADIIARLLGPKLSEIWKVPLVVENRGGAGGIIGVQAVIASPPDGYTLTIVADNFASAASVSRNAYDPVNDLDPVLLLARGDYALITPASFAAKSAAEMIALARANPGKLNYAAPNGQPAHIMMELLKSTRGVDIVHVPYKTNIAALNDIMNGQVSLMFTSMAVALSAAEGGRVRILAAGAAKRASRTPNIPSLIESGIPDFNVGTWFALLVPRNTPREIQQKLGQDFASLLRNPEVAEVMAKQGISPAGGTAKELQDLIRADFERWSRVVREARILAD